MTDIKEVIEKAREFAYDEIEKTGLPDKFLVDLSVNKGQELAEKLGVDKDIVMIGTYLMDVKLGECFKEGKIAEHVKRSSDATKEFLNQFELDDAIKDKIINSVKGHHGKIAFTCKEAEVCANADCYRFLDPKGMFFYITVLGERENDLGKIIDQAEKKLDEKYGILSLDICKEELEESYQSFKMLFAKARV